MICCLLIINSDILATLDDECSSVSGGDGIEGREW